jgi:hypothetical protein
MESSKARRLELAVRVVPKPLAPVGDEVVGGLLRCAAAGVGGGPRGEAVVLEPARGQGGQARVVRNGILRL